MDERRLRTGLPGRLQQMEGAKGIDLKIKEGNGGGAIVGGLGRGVDDQIRLQILHERQDRVPIANVDRGMPVIRNFRSQPPQHPGRVAIRPEKDGALVVVDPGDREAPRMKRPGYLRPDQTAGTGHQNLAAAAHEIPLQTSDMREVLAPGQDSRPA